MRDNKHIDEFIENKLRKSPLTKTSGSFASMLMEKIQAEGTLAAEETKRDKVAKYLIGGVSALIGGFTILVAYFSGSKNTPTTESTGIDISPALQSSNNYFERFINFIETVFLKTLELVGLSASSRTVSIVLSIIGIVCLFLLAERFLIRGKFKSGVNLK